VNSTADAPRLVSARATEAIKPAYSLRAARSPADFSIVQLKGQSAWTQTRALDGRTNAEAGQASPVIPSAFPRSAGQQLGVARVV
jgi:hypothetical protein